MLHWFFTTANCGIPFCTRLRDTESLKAAAAVQKNAVMYDASQRSRHLEPIFRLLLKVAVMGARECEYRIFGQRLLCS